VVDEALLGDRLFGRRARLALARWVLERTEPVFFQGEAVSGTGLPQSNVREELSRLIELGMVSMLPRGSGDRRQYYLRQPSRIWSAIDAAASAIAASKDEGASTGRPSRVSDPSG
jgi:DNA-binding transcriptional ArsR family regulator